MGQVTSCAGYHSTWSHGGDSATRTLVVQEVDEKNRKDNIPEARTGDNTRFYSSYASTIALTTQHPTVGQIYDFSFMLYLAQTCHLIVEGGWFAANIAGSGQITQSNVRDMWYAAGCQQIFRGFDVGSPATCDLKKDMVIGTGAVKESNVPSVEMCAQQCEGYGWCSAYSYSATNCTKVPGCGKHNKRCYLRNNANASKVQLGRTSGVCERSSRPTGSSSSRTLDEYELNWRGLCNPNRRNSQ